jgi:hypothetical protein
MASWRETLQQLSERLKTGLKNGRIREIFRQEIRTHQEAIQTLYDFQEQHSDVEEARISLMNERSKRGGLLLSVLLSVSQLF